MITYIVEQDGFETDDIDIVIDHCIDGDYHRDDNIEDWMDEVYGSCNIGGYSYTAYSIVERFNDLDEFLDEYCNSLDESDADDARWELRHATDGDTVSIQEYTVLVRVTEDAEPDEPNEDASQTNMLEALRNIVERTQSVSKEIEKQNENTLQNYLDLFQSM